MQESSPRAPVVLLVEDDEFIGECVQQVLSDEGLEVHWARHGLEALSLLERIHPPCLVLLDLMMPVMNGWEMLERMRSTRPAPLPAVVVTSATARRQSPARIEEFLSKPYELDALMGIVRRFCARRHHCEEGVAGSP